MTAERKRLVKEWLLMSAGAIFIGMGVYFFKFPNNFSTGGVSGLAVILAHYLPAVSQGDFVFIINMVLLAIGFLVFGRSFGVRTAYVSTLMSSFISLMERVFPMAQPMTSQPFMELLFAVGLPAVGSAVLFNLDASSGGTDIVAMILKKYTSLDIGKALMCSDCAITLMACVAFGMETGLFCITGLIIKCVMVDMVLENIKTHKCFHIITSNPEPVADFIINELHRGATELHGEGAFTHKDKTVLMTVVNRREAVMLRRYVKSIDPTAFLLITNTGDIIGKGFRGTN